MFHFNIDPAVLIYLLFIAAVLLNALFKKGRRPPPSEITRAEQGAPAPADTISLPRSPLPEGIPKPLPRAKPDRFNTSKASQAKAAQPSQQAPVREPELQSGKERPAVTRGLRAVRFTSRDDLRYAIVARMVIGPPKSLQ